MHKTKSFLLSMLLSLGLSSALSTQQAQWFNFDFLSINSLSLRAWGGTSADGTLGNDFFVMDNFTINESSPVSESSSLALLLFGITGMLLGRNTDKA